MKTYKKIHIQMLLLATILVIGFGSCNNDDYIIGGDIHDPHVNMTTYDFLKSHPTHLFDTTLMIIDKAGLKDVINGEVTFFAPTNYSINSFLNTKASEWQKIDERLRFTIDTLFKYYTPQMLRDTMGMYIIPSKVDRNRITLEGAYYQTNTNGIKMFVSLEETTSFTVDGIITTKPQLVKYTKILGQKDIAGKDPSGNTLLNDIKITAQTSGILSTSGVIHVLDNSHAWSYYVAQN